MDEMGFDFRAIRQAMNQLAETLGGFRQSLLEAGFSKEEALELAKEVLRLSFTRNAQGTEKSN